MRPRRPAPGGIITETVPATPSSTNSPTRSAWTQLKAWLPEGRALPDAVWQTRHHHILLFIFAHAVGLTIFGLAKGWGPWYSFGEGALIGLIGLAAASKRFSRPFRSTAAALACVTSSAVFTQFWGGYIEGHFHYFVVVALIALYQDWIPFLLAIGFVAFDHGLIGTLAPTWVYNHPDAIANPWAWAAAHAVLVLGECGILIVLWKATEQARARTDLVLASAGEGILGLDLSRRITFANPAAADMLGQPLASLVGAPLEKAVGAASETPTRLDLGRIELAPTGHVAMGRGTAVFTRKGVSTPVDWNLNVVREHGTAVGSVLTLTDAGERVRAEDEHTKRIQQFSELERLKEIDKFKTLFLNTAAHELHTPLTPLRLQVYALKEGHKGELNPEQQSTVEVLDRNVERLTHLVEDVLNVARLQANRMTIERSPVALATLVHQAVDSFQESARAAGVVLDAKLDATLRVQGDEKRLSQVLYNLLDNAIKFTPTGGRITVEAVRSQGGAMVRVRDTGVGLAREDHSKLFQPFSQAHNPMERTRAGSGLGLYICRGIVELHGGRIECHSDGPDHGATFDVILPTDEGETSAVPVAAHA